MKKKFGQRVSEIAKQIEKEYQGKEITLICILKGSTFFTVDLAKNINGNVKIEFIQVSSYGSSTVGSENIELKLDLKESIEGKDVIIVEDIIDTGRTLSYLIEHLKDRKPNSLKLCTLLDKPERRIYDVKVDYTGFEIPDKFVVGYGLDVNELYRNLPYIGYIGEQVLTNVNKKDIINMRYKGSNVLNNVDNLSTKLYWGQTCLGENSKFDADAYKTHLHFLSYKKSTF